MASDACSSPLVTENQSRRSYRWWFVTWAPFVLFAAVIFAFSSRPSFGQSHALLNLVNGLFGNSAWLAHYYGIFVLIDPYSATIAHFMEYAILAVLAFWALRRQVPHQAKLAGIAFVIVALYALSDELHQYFVPVRHCDWRDVLTDWIGAATVLTLLAVTMRNRSR